MKEFMKNGIKSLNQNKKKILFPFVGDSVGGSHIATVYLINNLKKINISYKIVLLTNGPLENFLKKKKIKYFVWQNNKNLPISKISEIIFFFFFNFFNIRKFLKTYNFDFIHTNDNRMHYLWSIISFCNNVRHIWHQHSAYYSRRNIFFSLLSYKIITISNFCKKSFTKKMSDRAEIVGNPFEKIRSIKKIDIKKHYKINKSEFLITYVGKNTAQKRFTFFLNLAEKISSQNCNIIFFIIGGKSHLAQQSRNKRIIFIDLIDEISNFLAQSDLVICPAKNEGFGRVIIEAMISKTLVLASKSGAHTELVQENYNGFLAELDSVNSFKKKIKEIVNLKKNERNKIIHNAYTFAQKKFSMSDYLRKFKKIYY